LFQAIDLESVVISSQGGAGFDLP